MDAGEQSSVYVEGEGQTLEDLNEWSASNEENHNKTISEARESEREKESEIEKKSKHRLYLSDEQSHLAPGEAATAKLEMNYGNFQAVLNSLAERSEERKHATELSFIDSSDLLGMDSNFRKRRPPPIEILPPSLFLSSTAKAGSPRKRSPGQPSPFSTPRGYGSGILLCIPVHHYMHKFASLFNLCISLNCTHNVHNFT